jgi:hypothetical protein
MATPAYQGANQPPADRGGSWLGSFGSFFGGSAPQYAAPNAAKVTETTTAVQVTAKETTAEPPRVCLFDPSAFPIDPAVFAAGQIVIVIPRSLVSAIDPAALAAGQIAIVVPRGLGCVDQADTSSAG